MRRLLVPAAIVAVLLLARTWLSTAGSTPAGQPPLAGLARLADLKAEFNREAAHLRVIMLLSASCAYCLKGASVIEAVLGKYPDHSLVVFTVWLPILPTDWGMPGTRALHRLSDTRVRQFWDANHTVAEALKASFSERESQPACCYQDGVWWDLMAAFPPGVQWMETLPEPLLLEGTVEEAAPAFEALLAK